MTRHEHLPDYFVVVTRKGQRRVWQWQNPAAATDGLQALWIGI
jgi:hypothetical protein